MSRWIVWLVFLIFAGTGATLKFSTSHETMPVGCDEFGYLNLAKAFDTKEAFLESSKPEMFYRLIDTLRKSGVSEYEIMWMATPHAYHLLPGSNQTINQYPPATSFLLHLIPLEFRKILFPFLVMFLLILLPVFASGIVNISGKGLFEPAFAVMVLLFTLTSPFLTELVRVNSVAVTFGFLIAAGMLLMRYPVWGCILIAVTINFRTANAVLLVPAVLFLIFHHKKRVNIRLIAMLFTGISLAVAPLLIYNYLLLGNPLSSTYSIVDLKFSDLSGITKAAAFYFSLSQQWLWVHAIVLVLLLMATLMKYITPRLFAIALLFPATNYLFFLLHNIIMDYYPYASAMILTGLLLYAAGMIRLSSYQIKYGKWVLVSIAVFILISGIVRYNKKSHSNFSEAQLEYSKLCNYDVVWCDLLSGTSEYVCNNNGFRYGLTRPKTRIFAMQYLQSMHVSQAVLIDDNMVSMKEIITEVEKGRLKYSILEDKKFGKYLVIE